MGYINVSSAKCSIKEYGFYWKYTDVYSTVVILLCVFQVLLNYLHVKGYPADEYKCLQSWPRRDVSAPGTLLSAISLIIMAVTLLSCLSYQSLSSLIMSLCLSHQLLLSAVIISSSSHCRHL